MPIVNYCKKCEREVPPEESCPLCGRKLTKSGLQVAFVTCAKPVRDWFCWSGILRIWFPAWLLTLILPFILEYVNGGFNAAARLLEGGFLYVMGGILFASMILIFLVLLLQGEEIFCYTFDADGVQARSYLNRPRRIQLMLRFLSDESLRYLMKDEIRQPADGLVLVRRDLIPWDRIRKVKCWRHGGEILLYRPSFWRILTVHCPAEEYDQAEEYLRNKMKRVKKVRVLPLRQTSRKQKKKQG